MDVGVMMDDDADMLGETISVNAVVLVDVLWGVLLLLEREDKLDSTDNRPGSPIVMSSTGSSSCRVNKS